jgi:hypothetical protein
MEITQIHQKIYEIRGCKVMLDFDLAELYQVQTKVLNQAVRRNLKRFPLDFMFQLEKEEFINLRSQIVTSNLNKHGGLRYLPYAFTEQGIAMLSGVLNSDIAIEMNIAIMRTFIYIRQFALSHLELSIQLKQLENKYDKQFDDVFEAINYLLKKDNLDRQTKDRNQIGYKKGK